MNLVGKKNENQISSARVALWYLVGDLLVKGLSVITTPIFSRILTKQEYGEFSNFSSWESICLIFITLDLSTSISRAKYDYGENIYQYISSITLVSTLSTILLYIVVESNSFFFTDFLSMDISYIRLLFVYFLFEPAYEYMQVKHRMYMKYKFFIFFSLCSALLRTGISIALVYLMEDKLKGRILGHILPVLFLYIGIYIYVWLKGHKVKWEYCKYALSIGVPLIPHTLSTNLLSSSDRIMIKKIWGAEQTAIYTLPYTVASVVILIRVSLNKAWTPWFFDALSEKRYKEIKEKSNRYVDVFLILMVGIMLVAPEIVYILGGKQYYEARFIIPPVMGGLVCQFIYTLYVNIEIFSKRTFSISVGTMFAALLNIILNIIFIPKFGYMAAAYTTLIGYFVLALFHFIIAKYRIGLAGVFNNFLFFAKLFLFIVIQFMCIGLYSADVFRYLFLLFYVIYVLFILFINRKALINI